MGMVQVNGVSLYYEQYGKSLAEGKAVLVLIHGYLSSTFSFRRLVPYLEHDYTILSLDLPGFGKSEKSLTFVYSLHNYGKLVLGFLNRMGVKQAVLIGHSMGGQIALQSALQNHSMVKKVVGIACAGYMGPVKRSLVRLSYIPFFSRMLKFYFDKKDIAASFLEITNDRSLITKEMMEGYLKPMYALAFYKSLIRLIRHREGDLSSEKLKTIKQPVLLMWGDKDQIVPPHVGERFIQDIPRVEYKVFQGAGHLLPEERPEEIANRIRSFCLNNHGDD
ncbi:pimeloyl-ACP methyl ester carboxylesterase [Pullulanibacillus pueri]|uniref:Putative hydrolase YugF n=1 Tax=Pullulanibacillus pueri TaxID=1437324 RepID=A0A8J3EJ30_9BACL|nr:alpha/beta hydrolase [Pullulanibacillus pueri]MBM7680017.1 pimeloyl-ACP methyl ester carboxylesterase [Pullulanibacillus pueri]GGH73957.1 putative hydrolase YugF [Pullulanibacillus pueri]